MDELPQPADTTDASRISVITIDHQADIHIIYEPLSGVAFVGNRSMADAAQCHVDGAGTDPASTPVDRFLHQIGLRPGPRPPPSRSPVFQPRAAVLLVTNECQLRCTYCYAAAGDADPGRLSIDQAVGAVDFVVAAVKARGEQSFELAFHGGGEPTAAWGLIEQATAYARRQDIPAAVTLTSNAVWSAAQCRWIADNIDGLTVSVDGSPATHDRNRPFANGRRSSPVVMRNLATLDELGFPYAIRMTAARPWASLGDDVRFLLENTSCRVLRVEPAFNIERGGHGAGTGRDISGFSDAFLVAWEYANRSGAQLIYSGADLSASRSSFCSAPENALIVTPEGNVVTCYEVADSRHPLSNISTVGPLGQEVDGPANARKRLFSLLTDRRNACRNCYCFWTCAGDCYVRSFDAGVGGHLARGDRCRLNQTLTKALLLRLIAQTGGVWRRIAARPQPHEDE